MLLNAVSKHYAENIVLNQLDLHIPAGQFVAVVGRSGGGKSTLLRLLAGLETPTAGDVLAGTTPLAEIQEDTRMMFQDARLLPWKSVIDNVGLGLKGQWRDAARRALAAVGLENRAGEWPAALSGGQKQRVALARALIHRPGLLLLDEPLGALDALTRLEMQDLIVSLWQEHGFTVLLVTHDVSEAVAMADRVLLIEEGKIGLDLTVDIPRPRRLGSVRLAELEAEVLQRVMQRGESEKLCVFCLRKQGAYNCLPNGGAIAAIRLFSSKSQCFSYLLVQIAREIFQPFQLFQRRAHFLPDVWHRNVSGESAVQSDVKPPAGYGC